jgi:hypothetical protein
MTKNILFYGSFFFIGLFFIDTILELASYPYDVLIGIGMFIGFIYLARNEKDSFVQILKDVHQSNLDDIEEQQPEENTKSISVKKEIQTSLKKIFKNAIGLGIAALIIWLLGLASGIFEFNDGSFKYLILSVPGVLIVAYLIVKLPTTLKDVFHNSDYENQEKEKAS